MAPPGYVGYTPSPMSSVPLKRTRAVERAAIIAVAASAVLAVGSLIASRTIVDEAESFLAGNIDNDEFVESATPYVLLSFVQGIAVIASAVLVIVWMYRIASNHRTLHRGGTWGPGWAIGGWFLPPIIYVIPFLMFRELWRASDPDVPIDGEWRPTKVSPLVPIWFVLYSIVPLVLLAFQSSDLTNAFNTSETALAEQFIGSPWAAIVGGVSTVAAAIVFVLLATGLGGRHRRLTGEDRA